MPQQHDVRIWRIYNNGDVKDETHVLWPHYDGAQKCVGYNGDVDAWSEHNKKWRFGCAQIMQRKGEAPVTLFNGYLSDEKLAPIVARITG